MAYSATAPPRSLTFAPDTADTELGLPYSAPMTPGTAGLDHDQRSTITDYDAARGGR